MPDKEDESTEPRAVLRLRRRGWRRWVADVDYDAPGISASSSLGVYPKRVARVKGLVWLSGVAKKGFPPPSPGNIVRVWDQ